MITLSRILSVCVWQFSEVGNGLTRAWQKCIFFFHLLYIYLLFTYIFLCIDHGRTALLRYVEWTLFLRWKPLSSFLRKSVCFQTLQPRRCLFKNDVASFVNPVFFQNSRMSKLYAQILSVRYHCNFSNSSYLKTEQCVGDRAWQRRVKNGTINLIETRNSENR